MRVLVLMPLWLVAACAADGVELTVDVRTDLSPVVEFDAVHATLDGRVIDHVAEPRDDWSRGARVAELTGVAPGSHSLEVSLVGGGRTLVARRVAVSMTADLALTLVLPRSCAGVVCPRAGDAAEATTCVDGRCAPPTCGSVGAGSCPTCTTDGDCTPSTVACAPARCASGTCLRAPDDARCMAGLVCDVAAGCVSPPIDAGSPAADDAGLDATAASDAALDASGLVAPCHPCTTDTECGPLAVCVLSAGATTCFPRAVSGACAGPIYAWRTSIRSTDGLAVDACLPPSSCAVVLGFGASCFFAADCVPGSVCSGTVPLRCSYACTTNAECPTSCNNFVCR